MHSVRVRTQAGEDVDIEYTDALLDLLRKRHGIDASEPVDASLVVEYFKQELADAMAKTEGSD